MAVLRLYFKYQYKVSKEAKQMADKIKLMESMTNLIQHVSTSRRNQEEIFATLSMTDLRKILSNLEDTNEKLRKITLMLLAELLYDNAALQTKFCDLMEIPHHSGKLVLTHNFPRALLADPQALHQITRILKDQSAIKERGLFWFIDSMSKPKILQVGKRHSFTIDPLTCIVGVWLIADGNGNNNPNPKMTTPVYKPTANMYLQSPQRQENRIINPINGKVRLNRSEHIEKYQQHAFKPQTPMKGSLTEDQNGHVTTRAREYSWNTQTPQTIKSQLKSVVPQTEPIRYTASTTERKNYQPSVSTFDTIRYIRSNNFVSSNSVQIPHTPQRMEEQGKTTQVMGNGHGGGGGHPVKTVNFGKVSIYQDPVSFYKKA